MRARALLPSEWWYRRPRLRRQRRCAVCRRPLTEREANVCGYCEQAGWRP